MESQNAKKLEWLRTVEKIIGLAVVIFLLFQFVVGYSVITGDSMEGTLHAGDVVFYTRLFNPCERDDIVVFAEPDGDFVVKRIVAVAGDLIDIRDGVFYVNGIAESRENVIGPTIGENLALTYPMRVPEGSVFIMGDNRPGSVDSRMYGMIKISSVSATLHLRCGWLFFDWLP